MKIDYTDASLQYTGNITVTLTAYLPYQKASETITFYVENIPFCMSSNNQVTFTSCGSTQYFYLIGNSTQSLVCTSNGGTLQTTCPATIVYNVEVKDSSSNWVTFTSHVLSTTHNFLTMSDNTDISTILMQTYNFDTVTYPGIYEDLHALRDNSGLSYYRLRITARNEFADRWGTLTTSNEHTLYIRGTLLSSQATYTTEQNSAYNGQTNAYNPVVSNLVINYQALTSDVVLNQGLWLDDSSSTNDPSCFLQYVQSEDTSTATYSAWTDKIKCARNNDHWEITILNAGFVDNQYAGQYHQFNYIMQSQGYSSWSNQYFPYHPYQDLKVHVAKNCGYYTNTLYSKATNSAQYTTLTSSLRSYQLTATKTTFTFDQFQMIDQYCTQVLSTEVVTSTGVVVPQATWQNWLTATFQTNQFDMSLKHMIEIESSNKVYFGNYTITVKSEVTEAGGTDSDSFVMNYWIKHWCWLVDFQFSTQTPSDYFIYDENHPEVDAMNKQNITKSLGSVTPLVTVWGSLISFTELETECGTLIYTPSVIKNPTATTPIVGTINTTVYDFDFTSNLALSVDIKNQNDETYIVPDTSVADWYMTETVSIQVYFQNYPLVTESFSFDMTFKDPCLSLYYQTNSSDTIKDGDVKVYLPTGAQQNYTIQEVVPYIIDDSGPRLEDGYCGKWTYKLVYQSDSVSEYDDQLVEFTLVDGFHHIQVYTEDHTYSSTVHNLQLITELEDQSVYPKSMINFTLDLRFCSVSSIKVPTMKSASYIFRSGLMSHESEEGYAQVPNCNFNRSITSYWANGTQFNSDDIKFQLKGTDEVLIYTFNFTEKSQAGWHEIVVKYTYFDVYNVQHDDTSLTWRLNLVFKPFSVDHLAPNFQDEDNIPELVFLDIGQTKQFNTGPATEDTIKASFSVKGDSAEWINFMKITYDRTTFAFDIDISPTLPEHIGKFEIKIRLVDNASDRKSGLTEYETADPKQTFVKIPVEIFNSNYGDFGGTNQNMIEDGADYDPFCTGICPPRFSISSLNMSGFVNIEIDQEIFTTNEFLTWKGELVTQSSEVEEKAVIGMMIVPDEDQKPENLKGNWYVVSFDKKSIQIQIIFQNPLAVSSEQTKDQLVLLVQNKKRFIGVKNQMIITQSRLEHDIPPQVPSSDNANQQLLATAEKLEAAMQATVIGQILFNVVLPGSLQHLWGMVNHLQVVFHLTGANIKLPGNVQEVFATLIGVTQFKILPESIVEKFFVWNFFESSEEDSSRRLLQAEEGLSEAANSHETSSLAQIGYESTMAIENLETIFCFIAIWIVLLIGFILLWIITLKYQNTCLLRPYNWVKNYLFWDVTFRFILEGYLEFGIVCLINLKYPTTDSIHEIVNLVFSYIMLIVLIVFPIFIILFYFRISKFRLYHDEDLKKKVGAIYEDLKLRREYSITYNFVYCVRRLVYAYVLVEMDNHYWVQLYSNYYIAIFMFQYLSITQPWDQRFKNQLEIANEFLLLCLSYHLMLFTDLYPEYLARYDIIGVSLVLNTYLIIGINMVVVFYNLSLQFLRKRRLQKSKERYLNQRKELDAIIQESKQNEDKNADRQPELKNNKWFKFMSKTREQQELYKPQPHNDSNPIDSSEIEDVIEQERRKQQEEAQKQETTQQECLTAYPGKFSVQKNGKTNTFAELVQQRINRQNNLIRKTPDIDDQNSSSDQDELNNFTEEMIRNQFAEQKQYTARFQETKKIKKLVHW